MRRSHYITPRSLSECQFNPSDDPIERYSHSQGRASSWAVAITLALGFIAAIAAGIWT